MSNLPELLVVIPLENKVLLPLVVLKLTLIGRHADSLAHTHSKLTDGRKSLYVLCVPMKKTTSNTSDQHGINTCGNQNSFNIPFTNATTSKSNPPTTTSTPAADRLLQLQPTERNILTDYGCVGRILGIQKTGADAWTVIVEGVSRCMVDELVLPSASDSGATLAKAIYMDAPTKQELDNAVDDLVAFRALSKEFLSRMRQLLLPEAFTTQLSKMIDNVSPLALVDLMVSVIETSHDEKLLMLSTSSVKERLDLGTTWMTRQIHILKVSEQIHSNIESKFNKKQREFYLRQQLDAIKQELGDKVDISSDKDEDEMTLLAKRLDNAHLPKDAGTIALRELKRIKKLQPSSNEWSVARNYLDLIADLPWNKASVETIDIARTKLQLDGDHFGLHHVKKRIIEYISVAKVKGDLKAPILCFVGPPGTGKTSHAKSIATSLSRKFHRISLGGVRDEADMRGHRRTYVGAMPGLIIQGLRKVGVNNPVILLDEIDKLVHSAHHGDPSAALLEILDPEQNSTFSDHYLNTPFDLSNVLFIATANTVDTIPQPLLDRMELIHLNGYTFEEKLHIARAHLLPKQAAAHGLEPDQIQVDDGVLLTIAENYTRESGVRTLERTLASVVRSKCVALASLRESGKEHYYNPMVDIQDLEDILGIAKFEKEVAERDVVLPGVVTGLAAYSGCGFGDILFVESSKMPGNGKLQLTGSLGNVIKESAQIALTWIKSHAYVLKIATSSCENIVEKYDIHIHFPSGALPKDGPSAGVTLVTSLVSLFTQSYVPSTTAMTGEISLSGQVLPVGGIKEKVISAHRAGIDKIILPYRNRKNVKQDVPEHVQQEIEFVYVKTIWNVLEASLIVSNKEKWTTRTCESHL